MEAYGKAASNSSGPDGVHWMHQQGRLLLEHGQARDAVTVLEAALTRAPTHSDLLMDLVRAQVSVGALDDARRGMTQLQSMRPSDPRLNELRKLVEEAGRSPEMFPKISGQP